jgi:hypothetical protein
LPEAIDATAFTYSGLTKTDTTLHWTLLSSEAKKGYSTTDPVYTLQVDLCGRETSSITGNVTWITLLETTTDISFFFTEQTPGSTCRFRIYVTNIIGQGPYSESLEVLFAVLPDA